MPVTVRRGMTPAFTISPRAFQAVIFDLDGVVTKTARVHAAVWKRLFDEYLRHRSVLTGHPFQPFEIATDYRRFVDGKPRYDGVSSFLESRGIALPWGNPADDPGTETVCGLGNRKNGLFQQHLATHGVEVYDSTVTLIRELRALKIRTAIVSSSRNCVPVLAAARLLELFDARIDGVDAARLGLNGKPNPDIFNRAAADLGVEPACAIVVEDAIAGVQAGVAGNFGVVIGVDRADQAEALRAAGADIVVNDLRHVAPAGVEPLEFDAMRLPSALDHIAAIRSLARRKRLVAFLDYDGTLTPIVRRPEEAVIGEDMRAAVQRLAAKGTVAIVSGRGLSDVRSLVALENILYAGSHGFEIAGPGGRITEQEQARKFLHVLAQVQSELSELLAQIEGAHVERKKFSVAAHYRNVSQVDEPRVRQAVDLVLSRHDTLRISPGKKVWDIQPDIEWHKGKALHWLLKTLGLDSCATLPLYIGDDVTDEDAFREIQDRGIGIIVRENTRSTAARYSLSSVDEVRAFLIALSEGVGE